jgi:hypothetical protein
LRSELFIPTIEAHGGRVVNHAGDGVVVESRSVVEAVRCALDVTRGLADRNAPVPADRRIEVPPASTSATSSRMRTATSSATPSTSPRGSKASARRADSACRKTLGARCATGCRKPSSTSASSRQSDAILPSGQSVRQRSAGAQSMRADPSAADAAARRVLPCG